MLVYTANIKAQTKDEREERITFSEFPQSAQNIVKNLPNTCRRLRFYKEIDGEKESFEAKFKYKKRHYSLEFSSKGDIEDLEVVTNLRTIETHVKNRMYEYLNEKYIKFKFIKIQTQYTFLPTVDSSTFLENILAGHSKVDIKYEIIAEVKNQNQRLLQELTFDTNGTFLNARNLIPTSYEHVLY